MIEAGLDHPREVECAVLGGDLPRASVPGEITIDHPDGYYSYAAKYVDGSGVQTKIPADLTPAQIEAVQRLALATFSHAGMRRPGARGSVLGQERRLVRERDQHAARLHRGLDVPQAVASERRVRRPS